MSSEFLNLVLNRVASSKVYETALRPLQLLMDSLAQCVYDGSEHPWPASAGASGPFAIRHLRHDVLKEFEAMALFV